MSRLTAGIFFQKEAARAAFICEAAALIFVIASFSLRESAPAVAMFLGILGGFPHVPMAALVAGFPPAGRALLIAAGTTVLWYILWLACYGVRMWIVRRKSEAQDEVF